MPDMSAFKKKEFKPHKGFNCTNTDCDRQCAYVHRSYYGNENWNGLALCERCYKGLK